MKPVRRITVYPADATASSRTYDIREWGCDNDAASKAALLYSAATLHEGPVILDLAEDWEQDLIIY